MSIPYSECQLGHPLVISGSELVGQIVYVGITCKSYPTLPRKLDIIIGRVTALYKEQFTKMHEDFYYKNFDSYQEIINWLTETILPIPEIQELNLSEQEFCAGVTVEDESRDEMFLMSRYSFAPRESDDFIDLHAFIRNIAQNLIRNMLPINFSTFNEETSMMLIEIEKDEILEKEETMDRQGDPTCK